LKPTSAVGFADLPKSFRQAASPRDALREPEPRVEATTTAQAGWLAEQGRHNAWHVLPVLILQVSIFDASRIALPARTMIASMSIP
jgi:hypothetical protein